MKICLRNKNAVLTKEVDPSWSCPDTCCFTKLYMGHPLHICNYYPKQCTKEYSYTLQDDISDIFTL